MPFNIGINPSTRDNLQLSGRLNVEGVGSQALSGRSSDVQMKNVQLCPMTNDK